jgi:two-component system nitrogen regulation response regulator NtrX
MLPSEFGGATPDNGDWERNKEMLTLPLRQARENFERQYLHSQVERFGGNISRTAAFVGMERSALHRKLKSLGIHNGNQPNPD